MRSAAGFTLSELLIAMALSLVIISMALTAFSSLSRSARQTQQLAELQQNAQLINSVFQRELANVGFWGGRALPETAIGSALPTAPSGDCVDPTFDSGSFPAAAKPFITLYAGSNLSCVSSPLAGSEILQLKRLIGQPTAPAQFRQNRFYFETNWQQSRFVDLTSAELVPGVDYLPYQHLVFYLQQQQVDGEALPVLMRKRLSRNAAGAAVISTDAILDGVERLHFEFGIDTNADGQLDYILPTEQLTADLWQQQHSRIISMRYHILLRSRQPDPAYVNNTVYQMGQQQFEAPADHYRRLLLSSSVFFYNQVLQGGL
jgi:type IV pilus assembly protein PilW